MVLNSCQRASSQGDAYNRANRPYSAKWRSKAVRPRFPRSLSRWRLFSRLCSREKRKNLENASSAELATLVRDMVGSRAGIVHAPLPKDDPVRRNPDIALAQKLLGGWTPQVPLERGLEATIAYFRGLNGRPQG